MTTTGPFVFYTERHLVRLTGRRARTLGQLAAHLRQVSGACVFYHTHHLYLSHHFRRPVFYNDFANWTGEALQEAALAEQLAAIDLLAFTAIRPLREALLAVRAPEVITAHMLDVYRATLEENLAQFQFTGDVVFVHDPQPADQGRLRVDGWIDGTPARENGAQAVDRRTRGGRSGWWSTSSDSWRTSPTRRCSRPAGGGNLAAAPQRAALRSSRERRPSSPAEWRRDRLAPTTHRTIVENTISRTTKVSSRRKTSHAPSAIATDLPPPPRARARPRHGRTEAWPLR